MEIKPTLGQERKRSVVDPSSYKISMPEDIIRWPPFSLNAKGAKAKNTNCLQCRCGQRAPAQAEYDVNMKRPMATGAK